MLAEGLGQKLLKKYVRVRVFVVSDIFIISLTFVRISNCSHGTVGTTTGFWSEMYGLEYQTLPTFFQVY